MLKALDTCDDGCPNQHYSKVVDGNSSVKLKGPSLVCSNDGGCHSRLRILRAASTHYPVLTKFLSYLYTAINSHLSVCNVDNALSNGDFNSLMGITNTDSCEALLCNDIETRYEQCTDTASENLREPISESQLMIKHAHIISQLEKEIDDYPQHVCCSCERLHQRKFVTRVKLSDNLSSDVWPALKSFMLEHNPPTDDEVLFLV